MKLAIASSPKTKLHALLVTTITARDLVPQALHRIDGGLE